jgi:hypothetical protein
MFAIGLVMLEFTEPHLFLVWLSINLGLSTSKWYTRLQSNLLLAYIARLTLGCVLLFCVLGNHVLLLASLPRLLILGYVCAFLLDTIDTAAGLRSLAPMSQAMLKRHRSLRRLGLNL